MLAYICLLAFIGLGTGLEIEKVMPSRYEIEKSINRTIEEVEKLIRENPTLPKLSRNDIVSILYNITAKDMLSIEDEALEAIQKTRQDYQRALMVVLPYKLKDSEENLNDLYAKPPMVQMVADDASDPKQDSKIEFAYKPSLYSTQSPQQSENLIENKHQLVTAHMRFENTETPRPIETTSTKAYVETTTAKSWSNKIESKPQKFSFNLEDLDQKAEASHTSIATKRPIYKGTFSRYRTSTQIPPKLEIIYSTTEKPTTTTDVLKIETTTAQNKPTPVLSSDQWHYYAPPTTTTFKTTLKTVKPDDSPWKPMSPVKGFFLPTVQSVSMEEPDFSVLKNEDFQKIMQITTTTSTTAKPVPIFVTPSASTHQKKVQQSVKTASTGFKPVITTTVLPTPMREEVEQLLKSIGLQPMKTTNQPEAVKLSQNSVYSQLNAFFNNNVPGPKSEPVKTNLSALKKENSFQAPPSLVKDGVMNLSPDIQLLFKQFGLQMPANEGTTTTRPTTTTRSTTTPATINSYTHFKPLPTSSVKDKDFRNFLAKFGLGTGGNRNQKAMQPATSTKRPSLIDAVPSNMRKILENIGLIRKAPRVEVLPEPEPEIQTEALRIVEHTTQFNEHIFKPHEIVFTDKQQNEKIKTLLNTVRMVQEGRANVQDVQRVAHDLLQSTKSLENGPDPLKLEEILNNYRDSLKNDVKRQEESTTTTTTTTTTAPTTTTTTEEAPTTEELDETALSSMASTDSTGSFSMLSESMTSTKDAASSSTTNEKKPSFFETFDINDYLNKTDDASTTTTSTTAAPANSGTTGKSNFFDNFDIDAYINSTTPESTGKHANANADDLAASFGGSTAKPDPVIPTRPKTGLYFLVDWNTFLEVGEEGKEKVNLRFQPKVGDRSRFISVKIP